MIAEIKNDLINILNDPESSREAASEAFARLYVAQDQNPADAVEALFRNHPELANEIRPILPERFIPKDPGFAVDGYIP